jgi:hypothetical protein
VASRLGDSHTLTRLQDTVDAAGARMVLLGDPRQLGAVGAGGMMRTVLDQGAEVHTLGEVRRFTCDWERDASLLAGRDVAVVAGSNRVAAEVSAAVRRHLVEAGTVTEEGVVLGRDRCSAGVGDVVQARRIDRGLGLTNRENYTVTAVRDDGGLDIVSTRTGEPRTMPPEYVNLDAALAYAGTVHATQGATVDARLSDVWSDITGGRVAAESDQGEGHQDPPAAAGGSGPGNCRHLDRAHGAPPLLIAKFLPKPSHLPRISLPAGESSIWMAPRYVAPL